MEPRPDNLLDALGLKGYEGLSDEERAMKDMLVGHFKERGKTWLGEVKRWRQEHPAATYNDAIRALYARETAE